MFGLETLDAVIGLIFVFLMLSLVCTAVNEIIEAWLNKRADLLEKGIGELLSAPGSHNAGMVKKIYDHPLVSGLFRGKYKKDGSYLPSYIPAENFAAALIDVFLNSSDSSGSNIPTSPVITSPPGSFSLHSLRQAIEANLNHPELGTAAKALRALVETGGDDVNKVKKNVEAWFNSSMDRVSGWYKRRTQVATLLLGFGIAAGVNADAITISNSLSHDKALRDSLVVSAQKYAEADAANSKPNALPSPSPPAAQSVMDECKKNNNTEGACGKACLNNVNSPECKLAVQMANIKSLGLPIGWDWNDPELVPGTVGGGLLKLFGWLITAFAISLGAPFWFDLLNKFMVIRSTVKPEEKSHKDTSKD
jgi:hypothetical protein